MNTVFLKLSVHITDYIIDDIGIKVVNINGEEDESWQEDILENVEINGAL